MQCFRNMPFKTKMTQSVFRRKIQTVLFLRLRLHRRREQRKPRKIPYLNNADKWPLPRTPVAHDGDSLSECISAGIETTVSHPSLESAVTDLHRGADEPVNSVSVDETPVLDSCAFIPPRIRISNLANLA